MQCPQCGRENAVDAIACAYCGTALRIQTERVSSLPSDSVKEAISHSFQPTLTALSTPTLSQLSAGLPTTTSPLSQSVDYCLVCGTAIPPRYFGCPKCRTPRGMVIDPTDPTATRYRLVIPQTMLGQVPSKLLDSYLLTSWHWGAAFLTLFWAWRHGLRHHVLISLLFNLCFLVAIVLSIFSKMSGSLGDALTLFYILWVLTWIGLRLYYGLAGMSLARHSNRYDAPEAFIAAQQKWQKAGLLAFIGYILVFTVGIVLLINLS